MTISESDRIDIIATQSGTSEVELVIADHLDWVDPHAHALQLQEKINAYLAFIESGQLKRRPEVAEIESPDIGIRVAGLYEPSEEGKEFLSRVEEFLAKAGLRFRFEQRPQLKSDR